MVCVLQFIGTTTDSYSLLAACGGQGFLGDQQNTLTRVCPCKQLLILAAVTVAKPVVERPPKTVPFYIVLSVTGSSTAVAAGAAAASQQHHSSSTAASTASGVPGTGTKM